MSGAEKDPRSEKIARTAPKHFLNNSRGLPFITQQNKGFEANCTGKFTRTFGKVFVAQFLYGTFSVPKNGRPIAGMEVYCGVSLSPKFRSQQGTALQMGGA